jgi:hypothetical protein
MVVIKARGDSGYGPTEIAANPAEAIERADNQQQLGETALCGCPMVTERPGGVISVSRNVVG